MDTNKMREQVSKEFKAWFAGYEKSREANGWMPLEPFVATHMHSAFVASREAMVVELPRGKSLAERMYGPHAKGGDELIHREDAIEAIEHHGLKVAP